MFVTRSSHGYGSSSSQYEENKSYSNYQSSSWRSGNYDEDDENHGGRNQGGSLGSSRGRGSLQSRGQGRGSGPYRNRGASRGGGNTSSISGGGTNRGYTTGTPGTSSWSSAGGVADGGHIQSLSAATKDMDFSGNWSSTMAKMSTGTYGTTSAGQWNIGTSSGSTKPAGSSSGGDWHGASTNRGYSTGASGSRDMTVSSAGDKMSTSRWEGGSSSRGRGSGGGTSRDRDSWQSENWEYGSSRGRGSGRGRDTSRSRDSSRGRDSMRGQDSSSINRDTYRNRDSVRGRDNSRGRDASRGRETESSDRWNTGQSGRWSDNMSGGRSSSSSRGQEMLQQGRDTGSSGYYSNRGVESTDRYMSTGRDTMSNQGYEKDQNETVSITERAMDILKAVLGPQNYTPQENATQDFSQNKRRRMDYGGEEDDYRRGPQSHEGDRGREESRWGSSSHNERYSKDSDNSRWVAPQGGRQDRNAEENRWGGSQPPRNTRHDESHGGNRWSSQPPQSEHFTTNFEKETWGQNSRNRNENDFKYGQETQGKWRGAGRGEDQWVSRPRGERQGREQKTSRRGSHSHNEYFGREDEKRWGESRSYDQKYQDQNDRQWSSRSGYDEPPEKRRKPLLGPCPDFETSKPKSLLGQHDKQKPKSLLGPHPDTKNPKPKPLLGSFPGNEKPKPKPLLGPYPGFDKPTPKSLLGPYPGHKQRADEESRWESQMSRRGSTRGRGVRGGRGSRGRGQRDRRHAESYGRESGGYGESQSQSFDDEYFEEPYAQEYQEGGWYEEPEWGSFEQFEEGGEWPSSSFDESQEWQYGGGDLSWQYGNQQQYGHPSGAFQSPKLSVRERLGAKKPALLGTAPSLDLVKQLLTPEERKRLGKRYGKLPLEALYCHMCNQSKFTSVDSYLMHQIGKKHVAMTRSFHAKSNTAYHLLKTDVQLELKRDRSLMTMPPAGYCTICDVPTYGSSHHSGIVANKLLHRYVKTLCCKQRFATRLAYENHRLSLKHLENDYQRVKAAEERCTKRLSDLKVEMKEAGLEEELAKVEEEEKEVEKLQTSNDRIKQMWTIMMPRMNQVGQEKLPEKIISLKTLREINLRMKKPIKNSSQFVPYDPSEPVGIGNMIISTHFRCSLCSKSIDPNKESVLAHCSSEDHYKNAVKKREEMLKAAKLQKDEKEKAEREAKEKEEAGEAIAGTEKEEEVGEEEPENEEEVIDDEPMEDPYEGESGDISTLLHEVEEMIGNEDDQDLEEGAAGNLPEGYEDELIYDDGDIAEEFREVLDYNPDDMEEDLSNEEFSQKEKEANPQTPSSRGGTARRGRVITRKEKPESKTPIRRTRRK